MTTRLGLRYVNQIDQAQIQSDLGRATTWPQLVSDRFLSAPTGLADLDDATLFACEVASAFDRGSLVARYGLLRDSLDNRTKFRLDLDRYLDVPFGAGEISGLFTTFSDDIFSLFVTAMGSDLRIWMEGGH
jgi:uncharacterized protein (TIGR04255 family)